MVWLSVNSVRGEQTGSVPPCDFNFLCKCSKSVTNFGIVRCVDVYLPRIPEVANTSQVHTLHMENNGLSIIEPYFLQKAGNSYNFATYKITIPKQQLWIIHISFLHIFTIIFREIITKIQGLHW